MLLYLTISTYRYLLWLIFRYASGVDTGLFLLWSSRYNLNFKGVFLYTIQQVLFLHIFTGRYIAQHSFAQEYFIYRHVLDHVWIARSKRTVWWVYLLLISAHISQQDNRYRLLSYRCWLEVYYIARSKLLAQGSIYARMYVQSYKLLHLLIEWSTSRYILNRSVLALTFGQ